MKNDKVVHVPKIIAASQFLFNEMVHPVEIDVGKKLRREIAYRYAYDWTAKLAPSLSYFWKDSKLVRINHMVSGQSIFLSINRIRIS